MSTELISQIKTECRFCNPPDKDRILFSTENFYVMLSLGPIVEGYLLLVSKEHINCCAAIPDKLANEFDQIYHFIRKVLYDEYGGVVSYEHGQAGSCMTISGGMHCFHAHMHFVPRAIEINNSISNEFQKITLANLQSFRESYRNDNSPYLFAHDNIGIKKHLVLDTIESQYLRKIVATSCNNFDAWDWVKYQNWNLIRNGKKRLSKYFNN